MTHIDTVLFDMYDTLCRRGPDPLQKLIAACDIPPFELPRIRHTLLTQRFPDVAAFARFLQAPPTVDVQQFERDVAATIRGVRLYPDTRATLDALKQRGIRIGLVSNLSTAYREPFFGHMLNDYITEPVFSCDVGMAKPERGIYRLACTLLDADPARTVMVGDSLYADVRGTLSAGLHAVHVRRNGKQKHTPEITALSQLIDSF